MPGSRRDGHVLSGPAARAGWLASGQPADTPDRIGLVLGSRSNRTLAGDGALGSAGRSERRRRVVAEATGRAGPRVVLAPAEAAAALATLTALATTEAAATTALR